MKSFTVFDCMKVKPQEHYKRKKPLSEEETSKLEVIERYKVYPDKLNYAWMIMNGEVPEFAKYDDVERAFIALAWLL